MKLPKIKIRLKKPEKKYVNLPTMEVAKPAPKPEPESKPETHRFIVKGWINGVPTLIETTRPPRPEGPRASGAIWPSYFNLR